MNLSPLKHKNFRRLWLGQAISSLGDSFYYLVFLFMVKKITGSSALVGYVGALETIPFVLLGGYAGVLADRLDRKRIMLLSDAFSGIVLTGLSLLIWWSGKPPVWSLLLTPFLLSAVRCFFMPAKSAAIPALVPSEILSKANALSTGAQTLTSLVSLSISAGVLSVLYRLSPDLFYCSSIGLNALSFFVSAAFLVKLPKLIPDRSEEHQQHPWADFKDGLSYIKGRHDLKVLTALLAIFRFSVAPFFVVFLASNDQWFGGKPQTIVWLEVFFVGGMLVSTFAMSHVKVERPPLWFANGLGIVGLSVLAMAFSPVLWLFVVWQVVAGLAIPPADIPITTYLQLSVPDGFRGRVNSVRDMISTGVMPIGMVLGGVLVERLGLQAAYFLMGVGMVGACLYGIADGGFRSARAPAAAA